MSHRTAASDTPKFAAPNNVNIKEKRPRLHLFCIALLCPDNYSNISSLQDSDPHVVDRSEPAQCREATVYKFDTFEVPRICRCDICANCTSVLRGTQAC